MDPQSKLPNVIIVGVQKAGTTAMFDWLGQHPSVYANNRAKDYPFFSDGELFQTTKSKYSEFFKSNEDVAVRLAADVNLCHEPGSFDRLVSLIPDCRLIFMVRNPVKRAYSAWRYAVERGIEIRSFETAIVEEMQGKNYSERWQSRQMNYLSHGLYADQYRTMCLNFEHNRIMVVDYDEMVKDPQAVVKTIFKFMAVDSEFLPDFKVVNKTSGGSKSKILNKLIYKDRSENKPVMHFFKSLIPDQLKLYLLKKLISFNRTNRTDSGISEESASHLYEYYKTQIDSFEELSGLTFEQWHR